MSTSDVIRVDVFSPHDSRAWVRSGNPNIMLRRQGLLIDADDNPYERPG